MTEQDALDIWKQRGLGKTNWTFEFAQGIESRTLERVVEILTIYGLAKDHVTKEIRAIADDVRATPADAVYYRYRHSETEKWHYGPTPQNWWECQALGVIAPKGDGND